MLDSTPGREHFSHTDSVQETYNKAGDKVEETKNDAKGKYDDTQQTIADKLATDPLEEARAHGQIPADTATINASK